VERLKLTPGFCDTPDGFLIDLHMLDEASWTSGYVSLKCRDNTDVGQRFT